MPDTKASVSCRAMLFVVLIALLCSCNSTKDWEQITPFPVDELESLQQGYENQGFILSDEQYSYVREDETPEVMLSRLLEMPGGVNSLTPRSHSSFLHLLAVHDDWIDPQELIDNGADVNVRTNGSGHTPLHQAAFHGNVPLARTLLENGADVEASGIDGLTPLIEAC